jgi:hypothetical protein
MLQMVSGTMSSRWVTSPASRAYERSALWRRNVEQHCSAPPARLASYDDVTSLHVLHTHDGSSVRRLGNIRTCLVNT